MITVIYVGRHELRLAEPGLVSLRMIGDLSRADTVEILHVMHEHLCGRPGRILLDVTGLENIPADWRQELDVLCRELDAGSEHPRCIAILGAHMLHKVILALLMNRASTDPHSWLETRFFSRQEDALAWLELSAAEIFTPIEAIYLTRVY